jgi:hypothetical protein
VSRALIRVQRESDGGGLATFGFTCDDAPHPCVA